MKIKILRLIRILSKFTFYGILLQAISLSLLLASNNLSQDKSIQDSYIEIESRYGSLVEVFNTIEDQTNFRFDIKENKVLNSKELNITSGQRKVYDVLIEVSEKNNLKFTQKDNNIIVEKLKQKTKVGIVEIKQEITVTGKVTSGEDDGGLPGANVIVKGTSQGTVTDVEGNYSITVPDGNYFVGF